MPQTTGPARRGNPPGRFQHHRLTQVIGASFSRLLACYSVISALILYDLRLNGPRIFRSCLFLSIRTTLPRGSGLVVQHRCGRCAIICISGWGPKFMKATYHSGVHKFALFVVAWAALLLCAGALVTSEDAALAVPDWPLSYGSITPPMVGGIAYEHSHRVIAAILGLLNVVLSIVLWSKDERPVVRWLGAAAVGGVILQGVVGGLTVLKLLHYWLPVMHACLAQIMF